MTITNVPAGLVTTKKEMIRNELICWIDRVNTYRKAQYQERGLESAFMPVEIHGGRKWIRIVSDGSAFCFVKAEDGTIWKAASWKGPAKNFSRGNIFDKDVTKAVGMYGAHYAS